MNSRSDLLLSVGRPNTVSVVSAPVDESCPCPAPSFELSSEVWPPLPEPSPFVPPHVESNVTSLALRQSSVAILSPLQDSVDWEARRQRHLTVVIRFQTAAQSWITKLSFGHIRTAIISLQTAVWGWLARAELVRLKDAMFTHLCAELFEEMIVMAEDFGMTCLASLLRHSTEQRIPPSSQGRPYPF